MNKRIQYLVLRLFILLLVIVFPFLPAAAQQHGQDTTYVLKSAMLDSIVVTPGQSNQAPDLIQNARNSFPQGSSLDRLVTESELNTSVSGVTKDLQRDLPSMIRIYTPQGIPLFTKYTSNNALTSTIPDSAVRMELRESSAKFPNPDAPVIMQPNYKQRKSISAGPLSQTIGIASGTQNALAAGLSLAHSGAPQTLQKLIPELQAYSTTYGGYGALRADFPKTRAEVIIHHSQSENEYGGLLGIEQLSETSQSTNVFINTQHSFGNQTLHAGIARQTGREHRYIEELETDYKVINEIDVTTYTMALSSHKTIELRANFHDMRRIYTYGREDSVHMQRIETLLTHRQEISPDAQLTMEARFDHKDNEPSVSAELLLQSNSKFLISINAAHLYDAVGSEALNSLMNSVQIDPHPWTTTYVRLGTSFHHKRATLNVSIMNKTVQRGWYGKPATISGWIARLGANGIIQNISHGNFYLAWNLEGAARDLTLEVSDLDSRIMPGPARLEGHASLEIGTGNMEYTIRADAFLDRRMRIRKGVSGNLGTQNFLTLGVARTIRSIELGATVNNALAFFGKENKIVAHFNEENGMRFVHAPPILSLNIGVEF